MYSSCAVQGGCCSNAGLTGISEHLRSKLMKHFYSDRGERRDISYIKFMYKAGRGAGELLVQKLLCCFCRLLFVVGCAECHGRTYCVRSVGFY
jgi:hypothetical protein